MSCQGVVVAARRTVRSVLAIPHHASSSSAVMSSRRTYAAAASGKNHDEPTSQTEDDRDKAATSGQTKRPASPSKDKSTQSSAPQSKRHSHKPAASHDSNHSSRGRSRSPKSSSSKSSGPYKASEYVRPPSQIPNTRRNDRSPSTNGDVETHHILTFHISEPLHKYMTSLRKKYFPAEINKLDAHVTLFHALPGSKLDQITSDIEDVCRRERSFSVGTEEPYSPRSTNILIKATSPHFAMEGVRKTLKSKWEGFLSDQDNHAGYKPHWTVMNKVSDTREVDEKLRELKGYFDEKKARGHVDGLVLWRYDRGWWKDRRVFEFRG